MLPVCPWPEPAASPCRQPRPCPHPLPKPTWVTCAKNYGVPLSDIDFFENDGTSGDELLDHGTADGWNALLAFLGANSLALPANYEHVKSQVDIEDLVDYVAGQLFADDTAWAHNRKWWRDRKPGGKWRWCFVDDTLV